MSVGEIKVTQRALGRSMVRLPLRNRVLIKNIRNQTKFTSAVAKIAFNVTGRLCASKGWKGNLNITGMETSEKCHSKQRKNSN